MGPQQIEALLVKKDRELVQWVMTLFWQAEEIEKLERLIVATFEAGYGKGFEDGRMESGQAKHPRRRQPRNAGTGD